MNSSKKYRVHLHDRGSIRQRGFDYASPAEYFVTICVLDRECLFGEINSGQMNLSQMGKIAQQVWEDIPNQFPNVELDDYEVMPNHVHGIVRITSWGKSAKSDVKNVNDLGRDLINQIPTGNSSWILMKNPKQTLGKIIRHYKARTTKFCHDKGFFDFAWQSRFHDHIMRNQGDLSRTRRYIRDNIENWERDEENPKVMAKKNNKRA